MRMWYRFNDSERTFVYRPKLVKSACKRLMILANNTCSKAEFESKSLSFVNGLFDRINIETAEYYDICKYRAQILDTFTWCST